MKRYICFDCQNELIQKLPAFHLPRNTAKAQEVVGKLMKQFEDEKFGKNKLCEHWTPEYWAKMGYVRNWGDASLGEVRGVPEIEILRKSEEITRDHSGSNYTTDFIILAPKLLRRPLLIHCDGSAYGSY